MMLSRVGPRSGPPHRRPLLLVGGDWHGGPIATPPPFRSPELPERAGTFCRNVVIL